MNASTRTTALVALAALALAVAPAGAKTAPPAKSDQAAHKLAVPFIADDYATALKMAREKNVPIFMDAWATWCHTCRSMKAFVLTDPSLAPRSGEFVWFLMDVENPKNAALKDKFPTNALPTFYVVDPKDESIARRWVGGMTIAQLQGFLDDGKTAVKGGDTGNGDKLAQADALYGKADYKAAGDAYLAVWPSLKPADAQYARVAEATLYSLSTTDRNTDVIALAEQAEPTLANTTSGASMAVSALGAAIALPADAPNRAEMIKKYEAKTRAYLDRTDIALADDDRSGMYSTLMDARNDAKDEAGAKAAAQTWANFLEGAAARAKTPDARSVFDSHRLYAYIELGTPEKAVPMLLESEKAMPNDYNPPARLTAAYVAMKQWDDALAASDRALKLGYGPRMLRTFQARADAFAGKGDTASARKTMDEAIAYAKGLPNPASRRPRAVQEAGRFRRRAADRELRHVEVAFPSEEQKGRLTGSGGPLYLGVVAGFFAFLTGAFLTGAFSTWMSPVCFSASIGAPFAS
jgi:thioredoxin-like negative regulator of GroEL